MPKNVRFFHEESNLVFRPIEAQHLYVLVSTATASRGLEHVRRLTYCCGFASGQVILYSRESLLLYLTSTSFHGERNATFPTAADGRKLRKLVLCCLSLVFAFIRITWHW